jgi:hypothetical protein
VRAGANGVSPLSFAIATAAAFGFGAARPESERIAFRASVDLDAWTAGFVRVAVVASTLCDVGSTDRVRTRVMSSSALP